MTSPTPDIPTLDPRREIEELLPWYVNGTLSPAEMATVEQSLARDPVCRAELEECRALARLLEAHETATWQPSPAAFDRLLADIDRLDAAPTPARTDPPWWRPILEWLRNTPAPVRWTLAAQSLALAALALALLLPAQPVDPGYETLSDGPPVLTAEPRLRVVFDDAMNVGELRTLLHGIAGHVVAGPTPLGVYTIAVTGDGRPDEALDRAANALRAHPWVRLVEPVEHP